MRREASVVVARPRHAERRSSSAMHHHIHNPRHQCLLLTCICLLVALLPSNVASFVIPSSRVHQQPSSSSQRPRSLVLTSAPEGALPDIVVPAIFDFNITDGANDNSDPRVWVPQTDCLSFRPLCFCTSQGYYVNLLKFKGGGILGRHRHSSPVHALTLKGSWGYREHDWHATPGTYVFEPPGETHTLIVDEDCEEMVAMFHVTGSLLYVSEESGDIIGFDDVFSKLEKARDWYEECGLGRDYANQFVR